jgi:hypothetical protein
MYKTGEGYQFAGITSTPFSYGTDMENLRVLSSEIGIAGGYSLEAIKSG